MVSLMEYQASWSIWCTGSALGFPLGKSNSWHRRCQISIKSRARQPRKRKETQVNNFLSAWRTRLHFLSNHCSWPSVRPSGSLMVEASVRRVLSKPYASLTGMEGMWRKCGEKEHFGLDCLHFGRRGPTGAANLARKVYTFSRLCSRAHATDRAGACHVLGASRCSIP